MRGAIQVTHTRLSEGEGHVTDEDTPNSTRKESLQPPLYGYYFTDLRWQSESIDFVKSTLLFFDGIALALPRELAGQYIEEDPILAQPLYDKKLLRNLHPEDWTTEDSAEEVLWSVVDALEEEKEHLGRRSDWGVARSQFSSARRRRGGGCTASDLLAAELTRRGLLDGELVDGIVKMDCVARFFLLIAVAKGLTRAAHSFGMELAPFTDDRLWYDLRLYGNRDTVGHTITSDLFEVGVDLSAVPLDEVLSFRESYGDQYREYMRSVRQFVFDLAQLDDQTRERRYYDRREEMLDMSADLRRLMRRNLSQAGAAISVAGVSAVWTGVRGDIIGSVLSAILAVMTLPIQSRIENSFTYLFSVRDNLSMRNY